MLFLEPGFVERLVILGAILLRLIIGLYSYSGPNSKAAVIYWPFR